MKIKSILYLFLFSSQLIIPQESKTQLQTQLDSLLNGNFFQSSLASVDIYNLSTQKILYQKNNKLLLHPASNMKILTSAAGLLFLHPDYNFVTKLHYAGKIVNSTLYGDLYVVGGCDPDFNMNDLDSLVAAVSLLGIKEITGDIIGDVSMADSMFWGKGWMWDDDPSTDAPYLSALNINDNSVNVFISGTKSGLPPKIKTEPETEYIKIKNNALTSDTLRNDDFYVDRDWINRKNTIIVSGFIKEPANNIDSENYNSLNIYKPELYFLTLFKEALSESGIRFNGSLKIMKAPLSVADVYSYKRPFDSVIVNMNKTSDNLSAEMTLRALAEKYYGKPATAENGIKLIDSLIVVTGLDPNNYRIVDGSGVSHYNLVSSELILNVLKFLYTRPELYKILYDSFPVGGVDGTLSRRMKNTKSENNVRAKTGTLSGVSCLSGYLTAANGNIIAFSIFIQNYVGSSSPAANIQNEICNILSSYR